MSITVTFKITATASDYHNVPSIKIIKWTLGNVNRIVRKKYLILKWFLISSQVEIKNQIVKEFYSDIQNRKNSNTDFV